MNKIYPSAVAALNGVIKDNQLLAVGGFGLCGIPEALIDAVVESGAQNLTAISNKQGRRNKSIAKPTPTKFIVSSANTPRTLSPR